MRILFICNQGMHRSRTAAELFHDQFETSAKGVYENLVSENDMATADLIVVMEEHQRKKLAELFPKEYLKKRIICWNVPDIYSYNQPALIPVLKEKMEEIIATIS